MFKIIMFVRKKAHLSDDEFIRLWEEHSQKVIQFRDILRIKDYAKTFPFISNDNQSSIQRQTQSFTFDAMGELWYENRKDFIDGRNSEEGKKVLEILKIDEDKFVDMEKSIMWLGNEIRIFSE